jgi:hypothetical protein
MVPGAKELSPGRRLESRNFQRLDALLAEMKTKQPKRRPNQR